MRRLSSYPRGFFPLLIVVMVLLLVSGVLLVPAMLEMRLMWESPVQLGADVRLASAALHTTVAFVAMLLLGALSSVHMRVGWKRHLNRISGIGLLLMYATLMLTATGMFYFGDEDFSRWSSIAHTVIGLVVTLLFCWHLEKGRRIRLRMSGAAQ
jgi:hypothetical protein